MTEREFTGPGALQWIARPDDPRTYDLCDDDGTPFVGECEDTVFALDVEGALD